MQLCPKSCDDCPLKRALGWTGRVLSNSDLGNNFILSADEVPAGTSVDDISAQQQPLFDLDDNALGQPDINITNPESGNVVIRPLTAALQDFTFEGNLSDYYDQDSGKEERKSRNGSDIPRWYALVLLKVLFVPELEGNEYLNDSALFSAALSESQVSDEEIFKRLDDFRSNLREIRTRNHLNLKDGDDLIMKFAEIGFPLSGIGHKHLERLNKNVLERLDVVLNGSFNPDSRHGQNVSDHVKYTRALDKLPSGSDITCYDVVPNLPYQYNRQSFYTHKNSGPISARGVNKVMGMTDCLIPTQRIDVLRNIVRAKGIITNHGIVEVNGFKRELPVPTKSCVGCWFARLCRSKSAEDNKLENESLQRIRDFIGRS